MCAGKKVFQSIYTLDGQYIANLDEIPDDCQLILVSENKPPDDQMKRLDLKEHDETVSRRSVS